MISDLLGDDDTISRMSDDEFAEYWAAVGKAFRVACHARAHAVAAAVPDRPPIQVRSDK